MEEIGSSENLVTSYQMTWRHITEDGTLHSECQRKFKSREHNIFWKTGLRALPLHHHHHHHLIAGKVLGLVACSGTTNSREVLWGVVVGVVPHIVDILQLCQSVHSPKILYPFIFVILNVLPYPTTRFTCREIGNFYWGNSEYLQALNTTAGEDFCCIVAVNMVTFKRQIFDRIHGVINCSEQSLTFGSNIWRRTNHVRYEASRWIWIITCDMKLHVRYEASRWIWIITCDMKLHVRYEASRGIWSITWDMKHHVGCETSRGIWSITWDMKHHVRYEASRWMWSITWDMKRHVGYEASRAIWSITWSKKHHVGYEASRGIWSITWDMKHHVGYEAMSVAN